MITLVQISCRIW